MNMCWDKQQHCHSLAEKVKFSFPKMLRNKGQELHGFRTLRPNCCLYCALGRPCLNYWSSLNIWKRLCHKLNMSSAWWSGFAHDGTWWLRLSLEIKNKLIIQMDTNLTHLTFYIQAQSALKEKEDLCPICAILKIELLRHLYDNGDEKFLSK